MLKKILSTLVFSLCFMLIAKAEPIQIAGNHTNTFWDQSSGTLTIYCDGKTGICATIEGSGTTHIYVYGANGFPIFNPNDGHVYNITSIDENPNGSVININREISN